jgi:peptidoglycan L-alanyl-D-glutamate endopeptidase CwlK
MFKLSKRSLDKLKGVDDDLIEVVKNAIKITELDFGVTEGLRTKQRQKELVARGASTTMKSKHIVGEAFDVVGYIGGEVSWEMSTYWTIAEAMKTAAIKAKKPLRWGGAWHIPDITKSLNSMEDEHFAYIALRVSQGRRPFIDGPHFESGKV